MDQFKLGVLFTKGMTISQWVRIGIFEREMLYYQMMLRSGRVSKLVLYSYDNGAQQHLHMVRSFCDNSSNIYIKGIPRFLDNRIGHWLYSFVMPVIHWDSFRDLDVVRSNQTLGAWAGIVFHVIFGKPFFLRTGYSLTKFKEATINSPTKRKVYSLLESLCVRASFAVTVSSRDDKEHILKNYPTSKMVVINKNYIDATIFANRRPIHTRERGILYVGRLSCQKNLFTLLEAHKRMEGMLPLHIVGNGELATELKAGAGKNVFFHGLLNNQCLPDMLNTFRFFILPSLFEGMPKTLLEAMSCGCVCLATDVVGNKEVIRDRENGILINGTTLASLQEGLDLLGSLDDSILTAISESASMHVEKEHSITSFCNTELSLVDAELFGKKG